MTDAQPAPLQRPAARGGHPHADPCATATGGCGRPRPPRWLPPSRPRPCPGWTPRSTRTYALPHGRGSSLAGVRGEGHRRAHDGRRRHPQGGRDARTGCSQSPVKALQEGGLAEGSKVGATLIELRRTVEDLDPSRPRGAKKFLGMVPFGDKLTDYFRKYQSAQSHLDGILHALRDGQDELAQGQRRPQPREAVPVGRHGPAEPVRLCRRAARRAPVRGDRRPGGYRPGQGEGAARRRPLLRPAEAPGPADPAGGVDPELPRHRHRHQEQHRADQGRRPRLDDHGLGAADRGDRGPGSGQPEARPRPDHGAEHDDERHDRAHQRDAPRQLGADPGAGGVGDIGLPQLQAAFAEHLRHDGRDRHLQGAGPGQHGRHHRHPGDRGEQVPRRTSTASSGRTSVVATAPSTSAHSPVPGADDRLGG